MIEHVDNCKNEGIEDILECGKCDNKFVNKKALDRHIENEHKTFACGICGMVKESNLEMEKHIESCKSFEDVIIEKSCRFYKKNTCKFGDSCKFKHEAVQVIEAQKTNIIVKNQSECSFGKDCRFYKINKCKFFHPAQTIVTSINKMNCKFGNNCRKLSNCSFLYPVKVWINGKY